MTFAEKLPAASDDESLSPETKGSA